MALQTAKYSGNTSRAAQAKRKIMETASELFAERGYGNVGINEVGVTAGFGKGTLYYHIRSKEDLLVSIIDGHMGQLIDETQAAVEGVRGTPARIAALTGVFTELLMRNTNAMIVSFRDIHCLCGADNIRRVEALHGAYRGIWSDILAAGAAAGEHRALDEIEVRALVAMYFSAASWVEPSRQTDDAVCATLSNIALRTILTPAP